jgi:hypothetical protein
MADNEDADADRKTWSTVRNYLDNIWPLLAVSCCITPLGVVTSDVDGKHMQFQ